MSNPTPTEDRIKLVRKALERIVDAEPATQEVTAATIMAAEAREALAALASLEPEMAWAEHSPAEIVRRTRCEADDVSTEPATWRACCDTILRRLGAISDV